MSKGYYVLILKSQYFLFLHGLVETNTDLLRVVCAWRRTEMKARRSGEAGKWQHPAEFPSVLQGIGAFRHGDSIRIGK
jgi:hypothetical protein